MSDSREKHTQFDFTAILFDYVFRIAAKRSATSDCRLYVACIYLPFAARLAVVDLPLHWCDAFAACLLLSPLQSARPLATC